MTGRVTHRSSQLPRLNSDRMPPPRLHLIPPRLIANPPPREPGQRLLLLPQSFGLPRDGLRRPVDLLDGALQLGLVARQRQVLRGGGAAEIFNGSRIGEGRVAGFGLDLSRVSCGRWDGRTRGGGSGERQVTYVASSSGVRSVAGVRCRLAQDLNAASSSAAPSFVLSISTPLSLRMRSSPSTSITLALLTTPGSNN